jgi:hypothetical protein
MLIPLCIEPEADDKEEVLITNETKCVRNIRADWRRSFKPKFSRSIPYSNLIVVFGVKLYLQIPIAFRKVVIYESMI